MNRSTDDRNNANARSGLARRTRKVPYDERQVMSAWESFVTDGEEQSYSNVRSMVRESWQRCKSSGLDARGFAATLRNDQDYLHQLQRDNHELLTAAAGSLAMLKHLLDNASAMIILTDRDGVILESFGDNRTIESGRDIHLEVGGGWSEKAAGTNGIGTALRTGKPVLVHAAEHYCEDVKAWTCAAAPIFEPFDGSVVGVVDLSGPTEIFQRHNMTVPVIAARQIEQILHQRGSDERMQLMEACLGASPTINEEDGLVILDRHGRVVCHKNVPGVPIDGSVERLMRTGDYLIDPATEMSEADIAAALPEEFSPNLIKPLSVDGNVCGTALIFERKQRSPAKVKSPASAHVRVANAEQFAVPPPQILGESPEIQKIVQMIGRVAAGRGSVLIEGETGVGKELFGRLFHAHAAKTRDDPFVTVNCGAITKDLFGGELFGHVSGAFTGALREGKQGKFEDADGGILCLDEIGEMPLDVQPFLLRALEDKVIYRLGDNKPRPVKVRLVAQTNRNLPQEVEAGTFRKDLFYRIGAIRVSVPPLRARGDDYLILLEHFNVLFAEELGQQPLQFTSEAMEALSIYSWPGNVRELRNLVESLHLTTQAGVVTPDDLSGSGVNFSRANESKRPGSDNGEGKKIHDLEEMHRAMIKTAIEDNNGNLTLAARQIGIARSTLYRRMAEYNIHRNFV